LEQLGRSFSIRVNNIHLDAAIERDPPAIIKKVYDDVFMPILKGAAEKKAISHIPSCYDMIEMAHPLPARGGRFLDFLDFQPAATGGCCKMLF
jgi:hypothetical protein